ncbi:MAG: 3'-5' exonuclease domain-containing protein 2 [Pseudomonadota bacterium]|nr:3'-5' exonuclease domain-containing protein 2 [Pseudomonadota bacterium]
MSAESGLPPIPDKQQTAALEPFERLPLSGITLAATAAEVAQAADALAGAQVLGFDTESKPTFARGESSEGPHVVQLATADRAWVFQLHDPPCRAAVARLLAECPAVKVGFGLGDDLRRIRHKLGVELRAVVDINDLFRQRGYRREMGVKGAVALVFGRRFLKSGKATTSNWAARELSDSQLLYAANDAWAALRVFQALQRMPSAAPVRSPP